MTLDKAIKSHKENIVVRSKIENMDDIDKYVIECDKKYVEWLEELKELREYFNTKEIGTYRYKKGVADAIDEYKEQLLEYLIPLKDKYFDLAKGTKMSERYMHLKRMDTVDMIIEMVKVKAEQLKEQNK